MHAINRPSILVLAWEEFLAAYRTSDDIAHQRVPLRQVGCEIHLLPIIDQSQ